nr:probable E3 ubiquitin-protein ligase RHC1A [Ipomoea trifida]
MILLLILNFAAASPPSQRQRDVTVIMNVSMGLITSIFNLTLATLGLLFLSFAESINKNSPSELQILSITHELNKCKGKLGSCIPTGTDDALNFQSGDHRENHTFTPTRLPNFSPRPFYNLHSN